MVVALIVSMAATGSVAAQEATPCPPTTEEENVAQARRWTEEALNQGNMDILDEFVSEDVRHDAGLYEPLVGRDAVKQALTHILSGFPGSQWSVVVVAAQGEYVAVGWRGEGVHGGEYLGIAPTGTSVVIEGINIYRFECGQIVESWSETDAVALREQLLSPDEATPEGVTMAPDSGVATPTDCPTSTEEQNQATAERWFAEVWSQQQYDSIAELITEDFVNRWRVGSFTSGADEFQARLESFHAAISGLRIDPVLVFADGDLVAIRWVGSGTHTGTFLDVEPTGGPLEWYGSSIFRFECGRIAEHWVETDLAIRVGSVPDLATPDL
jgi:predicted ester cyclase